MAKKNTPGNRSEERAATAAKREARREKAAHQAAALKAEQAARRRKERLTVGAVVAVVLALVIGGVWWQIERNSGPVATPDSSSNFGFTVGEDDAPTHVEIYADYLCPACASFEAATDANLMAAVEAGTAKVTHYPVDYLRGDYPGQAANAVAVVLDSAGVDVALELNRVLFAQQPDQTSRMPDDDWLVDRAVEAGAEESEVRDGIEDGAFERWVKEARQAADKRGLNGTPTIYINGEMVETSAAVAQIAALQPAEGQ